MPLDRETLAGYLSERLARRVAVTDLVSFPRGTSRQTWFVTAREDDSGAVRDLTLRIDHPSGSIDPTPLEQEYFVYERLARSDVPVARVLWWEDEPRWVGRPFYIRERIEGDWRVSHFSDPDPRYDPLRIELAREHLRKLAIVHQVDWQSLGFAARLPAPASEADAAHNYVRILARQLATVSEEPMPLALEACEWLHQHAPVAPRLCLCKGTNGYGEEVFRSGRIVAMSDWEEVSIGDPAADFAFMQGFLQPIKRDGIALWGLPQALDYYRSVSGIAVTAEAVGYYQVIRCVRLIVLSHNSGAAVRRPGGTVRQAWTGTEVLHMARHVVASAMGLVEPCSAERFGELNLTVEDTEAAA